MYTQKILQKPHWIVIALSSNLTSPEERNVEITDSQSGFGYIAMSFKFNSEL